jgi:hypothetical protein
MLPASSYQKIAVPTTFGFVAKLAKKSYSGSVNSPDLTVDPYDVGRWIIPFRGMYSRFSGGSKAVGQVDSVETTKCEGCTVSTAAQSRNKLPADSKTAKILSMERSADWDGEGAHAITKQTCAAAELFDNLVRTESLRPPDGIAPSKDGAIGFTWRMAGEQLNIRVTSRGAGGCLVRTSGPRGRSSLSCPIVAAIDEVRLFLALGRGA